MLIFISAPPHIDPEKIIQEMTIRKISFLSYATRGKYNLEPMAYGVHHRSVQLVELVEVFPYKYLENIEPTVND